MLAGMRLYKRKGSPNYYVEIERGKHVSLKTSDAKLAREIFREIEREQLRVKMHLLDESERITVERFSKKYIEDRQSLSGDTIRADRLAFKLFGDAIGHGTAMRLVDEKAIEKFKKVCLTRGVKPKSINTYLRHLKAGIREAHQLEYIKKIPRIRMLKEPSRLPKIFGKRDLHKILEHIKIKEFELWRIVQFAIWTGARRSEISGLTWDCVGRDSVEIIGKGDKQRRVDLLPGAMEAIGDRRDIGRVFHPYHKDTISHRFRQHLNDIGISGHFHMLRHTSATFMLNSGISLPVIQSILGHSELRTTQIYAEVSDELRKKEMQKLKF
jgi:integrase